MMQESMMQEGHEVAALSKRDRSLITCAALVVTSRTEPMQFHCFAQAVENGVTESELIELITHMAFYTGRSNAQSAVAKARELFSPCSAA